MRHGRKIQYYCPGNHIFTLETKFSVIQLLLLAFATSQGVGIVPKSANPDRIIENFKVTHIGE